MKIAFLILNHRHPAQLVRLITTLRSQLPDSPITVHHDISHGELQSALIEPIGNVHLLKSGKRMIWGDFSQVEVCCWSLTWMWEHLEFDWVVLLSAQDYPIKPLAGLAGDLMSNDADAVFRATPIGRLPTSAARREMHRRYFFHYRTAVATLPSRDPENVRDTLRRSTGILIDTLNILQPLFKIYRLPDRMPNRFGWRVRNTPFNSDQPCWQGSSWFALSRKGLDYALKYMANNPEFVNHYHGTMNPDESLLATLVFNSPNLRATNRETTYTRWSEPGSGHPDIFTLADFHELVGASQYFARKFDIAKDSTILDRLDDFIGVRKLPNFAGRLYLR